jgi:hypothetical protein
MSLAIIALLLAERVSIFLDATSAQQTAVPNFAETPTTNLRPTEITAIEAAPEPASQSTHQTTQLSGRMLDFEDIVALRKQGLRFLANGDFVAARAALQRAAGAGDAPAANALERAYPPPTGRSKCKTRGNRDDHACESIDEVPAANVGKAGNRYWKLILLAG